MIDIKDSGIAVITEFNKTTGTHPSVFDRSVNAKAVQIVISGSRGSISRWAFLSFLYFF
jgi:hypothetical protein